MVVKQQVDVLRTETTSPPISGILIGLKGNTMVKMNLFLQNHGVANFKKFVRHQNSIFFLRIAWKTKLHMSSFKENQVQRFLNIPRSISRDPDFFKHEMSRSGMQLLVERDILSSKLKSDEDVEL